MDGLARVFLIGGSSKAVRYDEQTTIQRVTTVVARGIGISQVAVPHFALRLVTGPSPQTAGSGDSLWLHPLLRIAQLSHIYARHLPIGVADEIKLELRMRFMPHSVYELQVTDSQAFIYLHEQVVEEFFSHIAWRSSTEVALEIAALKVCRDLADNRANKSGAEHIDDLDVDSCVQALIPNVVCNPDIKHSHVKKQFTQNVKKFSTLSFTDSIIRSLALLLDVVKFDVEVFKASLGVGWISPVELVVGPHVGLSYRINERCDTSRLLELRTITEISVRKLENSSEKTLMQLRLSGTAQPVMITLSSTELAQSLAHLLDGYQMMYNQKECVFKLKGIERCETLTMHEATVRPKTPVNNVSQDLRLRRELVILKELIGGGQFGNVYKAIYHDVEKDERVAVAVKVCKTEAEPADTQLILQESSLMRNFRHAHIISLIGVCMEQPMWLVMELAPHGELREYLQQEKDWLPLRTLLLFCSQLCEALAYLHSTRYVHRDIAARNVLVCSPQCVKLADFGLSRALDYDAVYTASRGKLPIKWLAPESVNYRQFSMASDVWMFGVCMWEIMSLGVKPWIGVPNADVITHIEQGSRPACPDKCPSALYDFMRNRIWAIEAHKRPRIDQVLAIIEDVREQVNKNVPKEQIAIGKPINPAGVIVAEMSCLPTMTLYRTMEEQRRQAEEDEKWLQDQEEIEGYDDEVASPSHSSIENIRTSNKYLSSSRPSLDMSSMRKEDSTTRELRKNVEGVCEVVTKLQNSFNNLTHNEDFLRLVQEIMSRLRQLFATSSRLSETVATSTQKSEIEMTETLIANDMKQMSRVMSKLHLNSDNLTFNAMRRDVVRICGELAVNCTTFLMQMTSPPLENEFSALLSNC